MFIYMSGSTDDLTEIGTRVLDNVGGSSRPGMIRRATSGYYGQHMKKSLANDCPQAKFAEVGTRPSILILGRTKKARVLRESQHALDYLELRG